MLEHLAAFDLGRVPRAHRDPDVPMSRLFAGRNQDFGKRLLEVLFDVIIERAQGTDIDTIHAVFQSRLVGHDHEFIQDGRESTERLSGPGRGADKHIVPFMDIRDGTPLGLGERRKALLEPIPQKRMKEFENNRIRMGPSLESQRQLITKKTNLRPIPQKH